MTRWQPAALAVLVGAEEITVSTDRPDGSHRPGVPIWIVRVGDDLYVRSYRGTAGSWYRHAHAGEIGQVAAAGSDYPVRFEPAPDADLQGQVDAAYQEKYARYGDSYTTQMTSPAACATTLRLLPAN